VIARGTEPVARLVPITPQKKGRVFGAMRGRAKVGQRFFEPLPDDRKGYRGERIASTPPRSTHDRQSSSARHRSPPSGSRRPFRIIGTHS